jgi:hypothetical protein
MVLKSDLKQQVALHTICPIYIQFTLGYSQTFFLANFCSLLNFYFTKFGKVCSIREISIEFAVCFGANFN